MISTTLAWRIGRLVAVVLFLSGAGWYARSVLAERDQLRIDLASVMADRGHQADAIRESRDDARRQASTIDRLTADRDAHAARAADLLRRAAGVRVITEPAGACAATPGADAGGDHAARGCGLSVADRERLESRLAGIRSETFSIAAEADRTVATLTAAQSEIRRLHAAAEACIAAQEQRR